MDPQQPVAIVLRFIERVNEADIDGLCAVMAEDHVFIDGLGNSVEGREKLRAGWKSYFAWFPDYRISHEEIFENHEVVAVFGSASGTYAVDGKLPKENRWEIPAAWKAVVRNGLIAEWRVYCDNQPARKLLGDKVP
ncbi:MAG: nuclear transport factor 2 family protein [Candidatus Acidiferrales bacterium]|jgi:ketosteroid isomerase-like protein